MEAPEWEDEREDWHSAFQSAVLWAVTNLVERGFTHPGDCAPKRCLGITQCSYLLAKGVKGKSPATKIHAGGLIPCSIGTNVSGRRPTSGALAGTAKTYGGFLISQPLALEPKMSPLKGGYNLRSSNARGLLFTITLVRAWVSGAHHLLPVAWHTTGHYSPNK